MPDLPTSPLTQTLTGGHPNAELSSLFTGDAVGPDAVTGTVDLAGSVGGFVGADPSDPSGPRGETDGGRVVTPYSMVRNVDDDGVVTFTFTPRDRVETMDLKPDDYQSGAAMKADVMAWIASLP